MLSGGLNDSLFGVRDHFGAIREDMKFQDDMEPRDLGSTFGPNDCRRPSCPDYRAIRQGLPFLRFLGAG
jgi:hypothetical protein